MRRRRRCCRSRRIRDRSEPESRRGEVRPAARRLGDQPRPRVAGWLEQAGEGREAARAQGAREPATATSRSRARQAIEAVEWEEKPTGIGEALVQIDPTLMEPAKPMPDRRRRAGQHRVDAARRRAATADAAASARHAGAARRAGRNSDPTAVGANATNLPLAAPAPTPMAQPPALPPPPMGPPPRLPTTPPQQRRRCSLRRFRIRPAVFPALPPRVDITRRQHDFFRDSGEIPQYGADPTDSIATKRRKRTMFLRDRGGRARGDRDGGRDPDDAAARSTRERSISGDRFGLGLGLGPGSHRRIGSGQITTGSAAHVETPPRRRRSPSMPRRRAAGVQCRRHDDADRRRALARRQDRARHRARDGPAAVRQSRPRFTRRRRSTARRVKAFTASADKHEARAEDRGADVLAQGHVDAGGRDDHGRWQDRRHHADDGQGRRRSRRRGSR